jgi:hypothetical protein
MLVNVKAAFAKCPSCNCAVDVHILFLSSLLGPRAVVCHWCGTVVQTDRIEWWQMSGLAKWWFFAVSFFYLVLAFLAGGLSINTALHFLETGQWRKDWGINEPTFWIGGGVWAGLVVLIQLYRIARSSKRQNEPEEKPLRGSLLSFQVGGQIKLLVLLLLVPAVCWVVGWIGRQP